MCCASVKGTKNKCSGCFIISAETHRSVMPHSNRLFLYSICPFNLTKIIPLAPLHRLHKYSLITSFYMPLFIFLINNCFVLLCNEQQLICHPLFLKVKGTGLLWRFGIITNPKSPLEIRNTAAGYSSLLSSKILGSQGKMLLSMTNGNNGQKLLRQSSAPWTAHKDALCCAQLTRLSILVALVRIAQGLLTGAQFRLSKSPGRGKFLSVQDL